MHEAEKKNLGRLASMYGISAAYQQRAVFITVLSFMFFLAMMFVYYIRPNLGYFLLATGFLVVYIVMLFSWSAQRRNHLCIFEHGFSYKKRSIRWDEIVNIDADGGITMRNSERFLLPKSIGSFETVVSEIRTKSSA